jgi:hypothetical protein
VKVTRKVTQELILTVAADSKEFLKETLNLQLENLRTWKNSWHVISADNYEIVDFEEIDSKEKPDMYCSDFQKESKK